MHTCLSDEGSPRAGRILWGKHPCMPKSWKRRLGLVLVMVLLGGAAMGQGGSLVLERDGRVISLEPYAPNVLRVTMSIDKAGATGAPGYGIVATPSATGWIHE